MFVCLKTAKDIGSPTNLIWVVLCWHLWPLMYQLFHCFRSQSNWGLFCFLWHPTTSSKSNLIASSVGNLAIKQIFNQFISMNSVHDVFCSSFGTHHTLFCQFSSLLCTIIRFAIEKASYTSCYTLFCSSCCPPYYIHVIFQWHTSSIADFHLTTTHLDLLWTTTATGVEIAQEWSSWTPHCVSWYASYSASFGSSPPPWNRTW